MFIPRSSSYYLWLFFVVVFSLSLQSTSALSEKKNDYLLNIVKESCTKSCVKGKGDKVFCSSYCQCVQGRVEVLAKNSDIAKILQDERKQQQLIHQCSGETAVKFFTKSCTEKCNGAPNCNQYCGCLQEKITRRRKFSEIGAFFIELGKREDDALQRLKRYEQVCAK